MKPFPVLMANHVRFIIMPDSVGHADGHPVLTYSYSIFEKNATLNHEELFKKEAKLYLKDNDDPDYRGVILFEQPGKCFIYQPGLHNKLPSEQVEELIEHITEYRDNPEMWLL